MELDQYKVESGKAIFVDSITGDAFIVSKATKDDNKDLVFLGDSWMWLKGN